MPSELAGQIRRGASTAALIALCMFCSALTLGISGISGNVPMWNPIIGFLLNATAAIALAWRHQVPWIVFGLAVAGPLVFETDATAALVALYGIVVVARGRRLACAVALAWVACGVSLTYDAFRRRDASVLTIGSPRPEDGVPPQSWDVALWIPWLAATMLVIIVVVLGLLNRTRSALVAAQVRGDAATADSHQAREQLLRAAEYAQIANDLHDTLANHLARISMSSSVLSLHSKDLDPKIGEYAQTIHHAAQDASFDLRRITQLLRAGKAEPGAPGNAGLHEIPDLVAHARADGRHVTLHSDLSPGLPDTACSHIAFRVVREALINARKHGGDPIEVIVRASPITGIEIEVRNALSTAPAPTVVSSGTGLHTLAALVAQAGGRFDARASFVQFVVLAWVPWHSHVAAKTAAV